MRRGKQIIVLGTGGNSIDVLDTINEINARSKEPRYHFIGFLDDKKDLWGKKIEGFSVLGPLESACEFSDIYFIFSIGSPFNFWKRERILVKMNIPLERFETIIHPSASVSQMCELGLGAVVLQNVTIASNVRIGNHVMILPNSVISHGDIIGDYTCIAGGVCISGGVTVGKSCYLGTNSAIIGNISIGDCCLIGMGSVIVEDTMANGVYVGNPGKFLRHTK
jgi:sugar O-acyltransferase (sialic acid O-acetyltransferase NeuD family)